MSKGRGPKLRPKDMDKQFEAFLNESMSSDGSSLDTARVAKYLSGAKKTEAEQKPWWMNSEDNDSTGSFGGTGGLTGTGKSFIKKKQNPPVKQDFSKKITGNGTSNGHEVSISRDSLDDISFGGRDSRTTRGRNGVPVPALSLGSTTDTTMTGDRPGFGMDTLAEMDEKKKFFEDLEKNSDATLDWSRMNKDLDKSATLGGTLDSGENKPDLHTDYSEEFARPHNGDIEDESDDNAHSDEEIETRRQNPKGADNQKEDKTSMLAKVSLMDSLDSTLGTKYNSQEKAEDMRTIPEGTEGSKAGFGFTNTSHEIEALHLALKQVGSMGSTRDFTLPASESALDQSQTTVNDGTHGTGATGFGLKHVAPTSTDNRTVDDLVREAESFQKPGSESKKKGPLKPAVSFDQEPPKVFETDPQDSESRGFLLSPIRQDSVDRGQEDQQDDCGFDLSPVEKYSPGLLAREEPTESSAAEYNEPVPRTPPKPAKRKKPRPNNEHKKDRYSNVRSSGYGHQEASKNQPTKKKSWTPAETIKQKVKGTDIPHKGGKISDPSGVDSQLMASVQSFTNYIQSHFAESNDKQTAPEVQWSQDGPVLSSSQRIPILERERALIEEVKEWQEQWREEKRRHAKVKADLESIERDHQRNLEKQRVKYEGDIFKLKQENFVLSSKITEDDTSDIRKKLAEMTAEGGMSQEQLGRLEHEIQEQEKLLAGYQQENERLYQDMKKLQQVSKTTEENMYRENEKLSTDLRNLKEQLDRKDIELRTKGVITSAATQQQIAAGGSAVLGAGRIAQLEHQLKQAKSEESQLKQEVEMLSQTKRELEKHIDQLMNKVYEFEMKIREATTSQSQEAKEIQGRYEKDIERLNRKLKWYAQNQELLDKDAETIKQKDSHIKELSEKISQLQSESGAKQTDLKQRVKERAADARKIQDLERQVKEMENIIRKRHPNSLPVLMWAASTAPDAPHNKSPSVDFLEKRIAKLEREVEEKDEEAKLSLRAMEQKSNSIKFQYEERIEDLELQLSRYQRPDDRNMKEGDHPHSHQVALQKELDSVRDRSKRKVAELEGEIERLRKEIIQIKSKENASVKTELKAVKDSESELKLKVRSLQDDLTKQEQERHLMQKTVDRLTKEKQQLITDATRRGINIGKGSKGPGRGESASKRGRSTSRSRSRPGSAKSQKSSTTQEDESDLDARSLPPYPDTAAKSGSDRTYQPQAFTGTHIEDLIRENEQFKVKVDRMELAQDQQRVDLHKMLAEAEARERKTREEAEERIAALRSAHQGELQQVLADHAIHHSTSRLAQIQSKCDTQEVMMRHLKQQLNESAVDSEQMSALRVREVALENQVQQLLENLKDARKNHSPEMRHFEALQDKIANLESKHRERERELKQIIEQSQAIATMELNQEIAKWKKIVEVKNRETEKFRSELDSILEVLRELRRQGVVLPIGKSGSLSSHR